MPDSPTVPAGTQIGMSYELGVDINLGTAEVPNWQPIRRPTAVVPGVVSKLADVQTYDDLGSDNSDKIAESFTLAFGLQVNRNASTGFYLPEAEALKSYTEPNAVGSLAVAHVRWYDKPSAGTPNPGDAYEGFATVTLERGATGNADVGSWGVTLTGKGSRIKIVNPYLGQVATVPTVTGALPSVAAVGALVTITGTQFVGATLVKFGTVSATVYQVVGGSTIVAVMPAGAAGSAAVTVTNATGISAALPYTRGA